MHQALKVLPKITFELFNRICLVKEWAVSKLKKTNILRIGGSWKKIFYSINVFTEYLIIKLLKTQPKKKKIDHVTNTHWWDQAYVMVIYRNFSPHLLSRNYWNSLSMQEVFMAFNSAPTMQLNLEDDFLCKFFYLCNYLYYVCLV